MIYIQSDNERKLPHHFDCACALYGSIDSALDYRLTTYDEVTSGKFDSLINSNLFVGSVEFMNAVFSRIGLHDVRLPKNSNRTSKIITLGEAFSIVDSGHKLFIKPYDIKLFPAVILDGMEYSFLNKLPLETKVISYQPFNQKISSEWRLYIHNDKVVDSRNYAGDFKLSPNYEYVNSIILENIATFPSAYTIDIGIMESGDNVVVEFNDFWAIGNYGIPNDIYLRMLRDRYFEIVKR